MPAESSVAIRARAGVGHRVAQPNRWLSFAGWAIVALSALQITLFAFGRDQGIYAVVGDRMLSGEMPYRDAWDFKPPGIFFTYAAAQVLFGKSMVSIRLLEVLALLVLSATFIRLARELFGEATIGVVAAALAALVHAQLEFWHSGQPESFGGVLTAVAILCTVRARGHIQSGMGSGQGLVVTAGVLFGCAFLLKPPLGGGAVVCAAYLAQTESQGGSRRRESWRPFVTMGLASAAPITACALWFYARGAGEALQWTLFEFIPGYSSVGGHLDALPALYLAFEEAFTGFSALLAAGCLAAVLLRPIHGREREAQFLLLGVISMQLAGVAMQGKFFQYHYAATLPLIALIAGLGVYKVYRRTLLFGVPAVLTFSVALAALATMRTAVRSNPGTFWERSAARFEFLFHRDRVALDAALYRVADYDFGADREVAEAIVEHVPRGEPIFVWGFEPVIYWLSDRAPSSRYIYNVPQRTPWESERPREELMSDLESRPPSAIVVQKTDVFYHVTGTHTDSAEALDDFPELVRLLRAEYVFSRSVGKFDVYLRVSRKRGAS